MRKREHINKFLSGIRSSIGLYPALISLAYFILAVVLVNSRQSAISQWLAERPWLSFETLDTPTAILTTLIGSIISLMVLSFSMVMVVLSQASSSFSPKILRGLVSEKSHQVVLGNYLGAILFCMVCLGNFNKDEDIPLLSAEVLISIIFGLWCLVLFVFFIHNASLAIQANEVIIRLYKKTLHYMQVFVDENRREAGQEKKWPDEGEGQMILSVQSGYLQRFNKKELIKLAQKEDIKIRLLVEVGDFIPTGIPIVEICGSKNGISKESEEVLLSYLHYYHGENIDENYAYGFTQLMEIAIKALSPGINDPGTARICIHYLTDLFRLRMQWDDVGQACLENGGAVLKWKVTSFESLLYKSFEPIKIYGREDIMILLSLSQAIKTLAYYDAERQAHRKILQAFYDQLLDLISKSHSYKVDKMFVKPRLENSIDTYLTLKEQY
ncbi:DUF2254 domain-containing protein [Telluribacter sp. SYSU D00476]|uniref:DUF2254 domain-containing protein n=1 Tax=Telluribacter sp. SYSU D00476 TaxID=2811430 RepID=UPI0021D41100|nr:DUF2254 domain-containing protein [Telluribacter sp. SYSU D00476]